MKNLFYLLVLCFSVILNAQKHSIMTYNIKLDYPKEGENSWKKRKPFMIGQIQFYEPGIFGVQEALPNQMKDIDSILVDYNFVGAGRDDGKNNGEYSAIFYNKKNYRVLKSSTFWLSETPDKVSIGWDAVCNRVCTYALFQNSKTKDFFWVFNTHFDHIGKVARTKSSELIINKIEELNSKKYPVILMGDFNLEPENKNIKYIKQYLRDSKEVSLSQPFGPSGTFNGFRFNKPVTRRIDYIFVSSEISVKKYAILSDSKDCKYPSDHLPVYLELDMRL